MLLLCDHPLRNLEVPTGVSYNGHYVNSAPYSEVIDKHIEDAHIMTNINSQKRSVTLKSNIITLAPGITIHSKPNGQAQSAGG